MNTENKIAEQLHQQTIDLQAGIILAQQKDIDRLNSLRLDNAEEVDKLKKTIEWYQGEAGKMMGAAAKAEIAAGPASMPQGDELHFNAQRLRNVAKLVGLESAVPQDNATLDGARGAVLGQIAAKLRGRSAPNIDAMVNRFLVWPLPKSLCSDGCVTNANYPHQRIGTNLLTADEAKAMFEYVLTPAAPMQNLSDMEVMRLREVGAAWMSQDGRDALDDWLLAVQSPPVEPAAPGASIDTPELNGMLYQFRHALTRDVEREYTKIITHIDRFMDKRTGASTEGQP